MNANELRRQFLAEASAMIEAALKNFGSTARSNQMSSQQLVLFKQMWPTVEKLIANADDPIAVAFADKNTSSKVDAVLNDVASGKLTPDEGKKMIALISMGVEAVELPKLIALLEQSEGG